MKTCSYCGHRNDAQATTCRECGSELGRPQPPASDRDTPPAWSRAAVLHSEVEARRLELELNQRHIPHVLISYEDSAFDGLYQAGRGWGHIETPPEHVQTVRALLTELRAGLPDGSGPEPAS